MYVTGSQPVGRTVPLGVPHVILGVSQDDIPKEIRRGKDHYCMKSNQKIIALTL